MKSQTPMLLVIVVTGGLLAGCVPQAPEQQTTSVTVDSTSATCTVAPAAAPSGDVTFSVTNSGDRVTEFYLLAEDGLTIVTEVEDVAPGSTRDVTVQLLPGSYVTACKPGMTGAGVGTATFTVT